MIESERIVPTVGSKWQNRIDGGHDPQSYVEVVEPAFDDSVSFVRMWTYPRPDQGFRVSLFIEDFLATFYPLESGSENLESTTGNPVPAEDFRLTKNKQRGEP